MSDALALEAHLRDHAHDEQSWRVYADLLLDRDDPRGKLVQLELRLAQRPDDALRQEVSALASECHLRDEPPFEVSCQRRHGFLTEVSVRGADRAGSLQETLERCDTLFLTRFGFARLAASDIPALREVLLQSYALRLHFSQVELETELLSTLWRDRPIQALSFFLAPVDPARARWPRTLLSLHLSQSLGEDGLEALAQDPDLASVTDLSLSRSRLDRSHAELLAQAPALEGLQQLDLSWNPLQDKGLRAISRAGCLQGLTSLSLHACRLGPASMHELVDWGEMHEMRTLSLARNHLEDEGVVRLADCPELQGLVELDLFRVGMNEPGALALASSPHLGELQRLNVRDNAIGERGRQALRARFPHVESTGR